MVRHDLTVQQLHVCCLHTTPFLRFPLGFCACCNLLPAQGIVDRGARACSRPRFTLHMVMQYFILDARRLEP